MEGDEVSFPSFTESDIMTGDVLEYTFIIYIINII